MEKLGTLVSLNSLGSSSSGSNGRSAKQAAFAIFSSFRKTDSDDPAVFLAAATRVLEAYPPDIVAIVADPLSGIAREQTFMPSIAELTAALERRMAPIRDAEEKRRRYAETEEILRQSANPTPEQRERAAARWERTKDEITGRVRQSQEEIRQDAEKHLVELYHARNEPLTLSPEAQRKFAR